LAKPLLSLLLLQVGLLLLALQLLQVGLPSFFPCRV
jgi:hypothetical protein